MPSQSSRDLPPGDYGYVDDGSYLCPARVIGRRGMLWSRVLVFRPFSGTKVKRVLNRNLIGVEEGNSLLAFKQDPMAVLHMQGDGPPPPPPPPRRSSDSAQVALPRPETPSPMRAQT